MFTAPIYGLGVTEERVYFVTYYDGAVLSVGLQRGEEKEQPGDQREGQEQQESEAEEPEGLVIEIKDLTTRAMFSIAVADPGVQPKGKLEQLQSNLSSIICVPAHRKAFYSFILVLSL